MRHAPLFLLLAAVGLLLPEARAQVPSADWQIAAAELALPPSMKADAAVYGYIGDLEGEEVELRAGTNGIVCDVAAWGETKDLLGVWCGPQVMKDYATHVGDRREELEDAGAEREAIMATLAEELREAIDSGALADPTGSVAYAFRGADGSYGADLVTAETEGQRWQIVMMPFTSAADLGVTTEPMGSMPWMMADGTPFSHLMVYGDPASERTADLAGWSLPISTESPVARRHFLQGVHAFGMGRLADAREHFADAVVADGDFALAHLYSARTATDTEGWRAHTEHAQAAAASGTSPEEQLLVEMAVERLAFDVVAQRETAEALVDLAPESPTAHLMLGDLQAQAGEVEAARASFARAIELAPETAFFHLRLGRSYIHDDPRDAEAAIEHMRHALDLEPHEAMTHDALGDAYRAAGDLERAREAYAASSRYPGLDGRPYVKLGHVHSFLGDFDAARASYDRAAAIDRANGAQDNAALYGSLIHVHAGDPGAAIDALVSAAAVLDGPNPLGGQIMMHASALDIALRHGMAERAATLLAALRPLAEERAERLGTDDGRRWTDAWMTDLEGRLALAGGDLDGAAAKADEVAALVADFTDPSRLEPVHALHGRIALAQGDAAAAAEHLRQADLDLMDVKYDLAQALEAAGETAEAERLYREVATYNFNGVDYALVRADALEKAGLSL